MNTLIATSEAKNELLPQIRKIAKEQFADIVSIRRRFHQNPELGFEEFQTSKFVADYLETLGLQVTRNVAKTGVVGLLKGANPGKTVAIRADMDALPIEELSDVPYNSQVPGKMHACGHDVHVASVLATARILSKLRDQIAGNVKFIFQPAEEAPGGAEPMIAAGVLENPKVDAIIGGHVWGSLDRGVIEVMPGSIMASSDILRLTIKGKGGHAAQPHATIDPVAIASEIVCALQKIVSRQTNPSEAVVISICQFHAGDVFNVIPDTAYLEGSIRTLNNKLRKEIPEKIERIVRGITEAYGATYELDYYFGYPVTVNNPTITESVRQSAISALGADNVQLSAQASMGAEDFAYYLLNVPGTFVRVGVRNAEKGICQDIHHPRFNVDESVLETTPVVYAQAIIDLLSI